ncbi:MAG: hypothetical protein ABFD91_18945 [Anaerohalosphaeraceae bacterium]
MGDAGLERKNVKPSDASTYEISKKSTVQNPVHSTQISPELTALVKAWNDLSEATRKQIMAIAGLVEYKNKISARRSR